MFVVIGIHTAVMLVWWLWMQRYPNSTDKKGGFPAEICVTFPKNLFFGVSKPKDNDKDKDIDKDKDKEGASPRKPVSPCQWNFEKDLDNQKTTTALKSNNYQVSCIAIICSGFQTKQIWQGQRQLNFEAEFKLWAQYKMCRHKEVCSTSHD